MGALVSLCQISDCVLGSAATPTEGRGRPGHLAGASLVVPEETRSSQSPAFHPDAPTGSGFWHWVVAGVTPTVTQLLPPPALAAGAAACSVSTRSHHVRAQASGKIASQKIVCSRERVRRFLPAIFFGETPSQKTPDTGLTS